MKIASAVVPRKIAQFETNLITGLEKDCETLQNITQDFAPMMTRYHVFFFWEQLPTDVKYSMSYIVERDSAAPVIDGTGRCGIAANHREMCKFESIRSPGFSVIAATLKRYARDAPEIIDTRLDESTKMLDERRKREALELVKGCQISIWPTVRTHTEVGKGTLDWKVWTELATILVMLGSIIWPVGY